MKHYSEINLRAQAQHVSIGGLRLTSGENAKPWEEQRSGHDDRPLSKPGGRSERFAGEKWKQMPTLSRNSKGEQERREPNKKGCCGSL